MAKKFPSWYFGGFIHAEEAREWTVWIIELHYENGHLYLDTNYEKKKKKNKRYKLHHTYSDSIY